MPFNEKKIIVNSRFLTQKISGVQRFAIEISLELVKSKLNIEFVSPCNIIQEEYASILGVKKIGPKFISGHLWEQTIFPLYVIQKKGVALSFCNTGPVILNSQIITLHDLAFKTHPEWFSSRFSTYYNWLIPLIAKRAKHVFTVSHVSKEEIRNNYLIPKEKITVIYNGVRSNIMNNSKLNNQNKISQKVKEYIKHEYILTVSSFNPRKNLKRLIQAYSDLQIPDLKLYVVGEKSSNFKKMEYEGPEGVEFMENIDDFELNELYKNSKIFVYPSLYEGFGIPIIEALAHKKKVCASDLPVFNEICGDSIVYFDPNDPADIKSKIIETLHDIKNINWDYKKYNWKVSSEKMESRIFELIKKS